MGEIKALNRIEDGPECSAAVEVDFLRFPVTYTVVLDPNESDGWNAQWQYLPNFDEAHAFETSSPISIAYANTELSLAQAREQTRIDRANANAARVSRRSNEKLLASHMQTHQLAGLKVVDSVKKRRCDSKLAKRTAALGALACEL
ncbi:hypothetical protein [Aurantiacibacter suaedae]|uniref:hypothetical protein n=1 Tax=Aurantiacibacter suaedae TaxID=2545755 RepID=UPI0010F5A568|nr:hypothetical protein [Aurantiacibacter suaedae]